MPLLCLFSSFASTSDYVSLLCRCLLPLINSSYSFSVLLFLCYSPVHFWFPSSSLSLLPSSLHLFVLLILSFILYYSSFIALLTLLFVFAIVLLTSSSLFALVPVLSACFLLFYLMLLSGFITRSLRLMFIFYFPSFITLVPLSCTVSYPPFYSLSFVSLSRCCSYSWSYSLTFVSFLVSFYFAVFFFAFRRSYDVTLSVYYLDFYCSIILTDLCFSFSSFARSYPSLHFPYSLVFHLIILCLLLLYLFSALLFVNRCYISLVSFA